MRFLVCRKQEPAQSAFSDIRLSCQAVFRSLRREIQLLEAREQGLGQTSPHFRSQIASEKDMFNTETTETVSIHHTSQPQRIPELHSNLGLRQNTGNEGYTDFVHLFLTTS